MRNLIASGVTPVTVIPSVGSMNEVSSRIDEIDRILIAFPLLLKAYRLNLVVRDGGELLPLKGQLDRILKALQGDNTPGDPQ